MGDEKMIVIEKDEDGVWVCEVPKLPGCVAHGATRAVALADLRSAIKEWVGAAYQMERCTYKDLIAALHAALEIPTIDVTESDDG